MERKSRDAFTLVELLVSIAVLSIIMLVTFSMIGQMSDVFKKTSGKITAFQDARLAFESITRSLSQVTLNTYTDYDSATNPQNYLRKSDLRFYSAPAGSTTQSGGPAPGTPGCGQAVFFYCPGGYTATPGTYGGMDALLNLCGYYVLFTADPNVPSFLPSSAKNYRYRLMQLLVPAEVANSVYPTPSNPPDAVAADWTNWFSTLSWFSSYTQTSSAYVTPLADNIIALIVRPQDPSQTPADANSGEGDYVYDTAYKNTAYPQQSSANQLPPVIQVTMVAMDEGSALQLQNGSTPPAVISQALNGKFATVANYSTDLASLQTALNNAHIKYQVFSSGVPVLETKWSK